MGMFSRKAVETHVVTWDGSYSYDVVGESYHRPELLALIKSAPEDQRAQGEVWTVALLVREPTNKYDKNAIKVTIDGRHVGYVPKEDARTVGSFVERVEAQAGPVGVRAVIGWSTYGGDDAPIGVRLDMFDPADGNADVRLVPLSELTPVHLVTERPVTVTTKAATASRKQPVVRDPKTLGPLFARVQAGHLPRKDYERLGELSDMLDDACRILADEESATVERARDLFASFGIDAGASFTTDDLAVALEGIADLASDLHVGCDSLNDDWGDADKDARDDLRDEIEMNVSDLLDEIASPSVLPSSSGTVAATPAPIATLLVEDGQTFTGYGVEVTLGPTTLRLHPTNKAAGTALTSKRGSGDVVLSRAQVSSVAYKAPGRLINGELTVSTTEGGSYRVHVLHKHGDAFAILRDALSGATPTVADPVAAPVAAAMPPADWYPNPEGPGRRYWDGNQWTEHLVP